MEGSNQDVTNLGTVEQQVNINSQLGEINFSSTSRLAQRFKRLKVEVEQNIHFKDFLEDFRRYNTKLDGRSMPEKLADAGFTQKEILKATEKKHLYSKKLEKNKLYESAQQIDLELFALIDAKFETYVDPLIEAKASKADIKRCVHEYVVQPIYDLLNKDGKDDIHLNYTFEDVSGMVYFLTGKCHLNWAIYDNV